MCQRNLQFPWISNGPSEVESNMTINNKEHSLIKGVDEIIETLYNTAALNLKNVVINLIISSMLLQLDVYFWGYSSVYIICPLEPLEATSCLLHLYYSCKLVVMQKYEMWKSE